MTTVEQKSRDGTTHRYGGELPLGCDPVVSHPRQLSGNVLAFSHGRAALSWLISTRGPFQSSAICAYTCPTVPAHLARVGLEPALFDYGSGDVEAIAGGLAGRTLVLLPAPFGLEPWIDAVSLAGTLGDKACVVVDAAQSAFGHEDFPVPEGGAVLSCPRKAVAIGDGALLAVDGLTDAERESVATLNEAHEAEELKQKARRLFAQYDPETEQEALALARSAEDALPSSVCRMSDASLDTFLNVDPLAHRARRQDNARRLHATLGAVCEPVLSGEGTPFNFPVLVDDRDGLLDRLHRRRLFATALWPDAVHDPVLHPVAARYAARLLALPIDQRYGPDEMHEISRIVLDCLQS